MTRRGPDTEEAVRLLSGRMREPSLARPSRRGLGAAFGLLAAAAGVAALGVGVWLWPGGASGPQWLGPRRVVPPVLRTRFAGADIVFVLAWRSEQDASDAPEAPPPRERLELLAFEGAEMRPRFEMWLVSAPFGELPESGLIAEQAGTVWLWAGGLGAVSAVDGRVLADQDGIAGVNPEAPHGLFGSRRLWQVRDALTLDRGGLGAALRIDPRDFRISPVTVPPMRPLPPIHAAAAAPTAGLGPAPFRLAEARIGETWFGLPPETRRLAGPMAAQGPAGRYIPATAPAPGQAQSLWRGTLRRGAAGAQDRGQPAERVVDPEPVPGVAGLHLAGFLSAGGSAPVALADPAGLLLLHGAPGRDLSLIRIDAEGGVVWRCQLPIAALNAVMPGPGHLVLLGGPAGAGITESWPVSVMLADGAVTERRLTPAAPG